MTELVKRAAEKIRSQTEQEASQSSLKTDETVPNPDSECSNEKDEDLVPMQALQVCKPKFRHIVKHESVINKPNVDNALNSDPSQTTLPSQYQNQTVESLTRKPTKEKSPCNITEQTFETKSQEAVLLEPKSAKIKPIGIFPRVERPSVDFQDSEKPVLIEPKPVKVRPKSVHCWSVSEKSNECFESKLFPIGRPELSISTPELSSDVQWPMDDTVGQVIPQVDTPLSAALQEVDKFNPGKSHHSIYLPVLYLMLCHLERIT